MSPPVAMPIKTDSKTTTCALMSPGIKVEPRPSSLTPAWAADGICLGSMSIVNFLDVGELNVV